MTFLESYQELAWGIEELMRLLTLYHKQPEKKELKKQVLLLNDKMHSLGKRIGGEILTIDQELFEQIRIFVEQPESKGTYNSIKKMAEELHNSLKQL